MDIQIQVKGIGELVRNLRDLGVNRIPNYVARSLTMLAENVQTAMIEETMGHLTVRGSWIRPGTRYGINRTAATKDNLTAVVSTRAGWLVEQELDPQHTARASGHLLVPFAAVRASRTETAVIPRRMTPSRMGDKLIRIETKKGPVLFERIKGGAGRGKARKTVSMLIPLWALERQVRIPKRVHLLDKADAVINERWRPVTSEMLRRAIAERG